MKYIGLALAVISFVALGFGLFIGFAQSAWADALLPIGIAVLFGIPGGLLIVLGDRMNP